MPPTIIRQIGYGYAIEGADSKGIFYNNNDLYYVNGETGVISEVLDYRRAYPRYAIASRDSTGDGISSHFQHGRSNLQSC